MNRGRLLKVLFYYLLIATIVFFLGPLGHIPGYVLMVGVTLLFLLTSGIRIRTGNPLPGTIAGTLAITAAFLLILALGGVTVAGMNSNAFGAIAFGLFLQAFVACGEEFAFRQYVFEDLDLAAGRNAAIALSAAGFALLHLHSMLSFGVDPVSAIVGLTTIGIAGVTLALLYIYGGLLSAIAFHFFWNFLQYHVFGLGLRGTIPALLDVRQAGSALLNGGPFGPEVSLPGLAVMIITLAAVWYYYARRGMRRPANPSHPDARDARSAR
ncbi:MAG: CAAX amino terminal protease self- immunity [Methanocella sp. PtaU1.Bin125]|nr:MAG: CAAX amino terminal protease self- immunity [Methanocella sp. PtaU1.Bin125]